MQCPYCQAPAFETQLQCAQCGFSLDTVQSFFGIMPRLLPGVSDLASLLHSRDHRRIEDATARLRARFPQVTFSIATVRLHPAQPLTAYSFWLFNRGGICREVNRGALSRDLLLTIDAESARATLMIGYGLEPFVSQSALQELIRPATTEFTAQRWVDGIISVIDRTAAALGQIHQTLPRTYGLDMHAVRREEDPAPALAFPTGTY